ncbi:MAG: histidine phosphatase family protein [Pseudobutyrivibrio sp.]|nr:histidine phosphatase family protein [Pseudobutyrivibrio sp.]
MRLLLIRHGQTELNVLKRLQGSSDIPLNDNGRNQARTTHQYMVENNIVPTKLICSPLDRAIETGELISGMDRSKAEIMPELIEMGFGIYEQKEMEKEDPGFVDRCFNHPETYEAPEGGETYDQVLARAAKVIETMRARINSGYYKDQDIVALVSHGATSHGIIEYVTGNTREHYWDIDINNCAIIEIFLSEDGKRDSYKIISEGFEKNW